MEHQKARQRAGLVVLSALVMLGTACGGPSTGSTAPAPDSSPSPVGPTTFSVTVDGLSVTGHCTGTRDPGKPAVVLQAGNGGGADSLRGIEGHMSARTLVCAFGRPGADGNPAPPGLPRRVDAVVTEVHDILAAAEIEPPYLLVGHSAGAAISFMFAQKYADDVAGFVAINGNPPYRTWRTEARSIPIPQEFLDGAEADYSGENPERIDFRSNETMLTGPLPASMPYVVMYDEDCGGAPGCDVAWEAALVERLAQVGAGGTFIWAKGAGHEIPETEPELVNETLDEVWDRATGG